MYDNLHHFTLQFSRWYVTFSFTHRPTKADIEQQWEKWLQGVEETEVYREFRNALLAKAAHPIEVIENDHG